MHIPDGYLSPQTYIPAYGIMIGMWSIGIAKVKKSLRLRQVPLLALGAAFCFVIMMFNVPIPGGTTGHAVGGVIVAILLGPWAAMIAVSLALIVQALLFGDGGITAIGANCFNMGVVLPFTGWWIYRLIAGSSPAQSARKWIGGAVGGYAGLSIAALFAGVEFGIQPMIAHDAAGRALYCPFGLNIAVPAMVLEHMLVFGFVEAIVSGLLVVYFLRTAPELFSSAITVNRKPMALIPKIAIGLGILILLAPIGLYLPDHFKAGSAWGEWGSDKIREEVAKESGKDEGYVPQGIENAEDHGWKAPLPDYNLPGMESVPLSKLSMTYILSGAIGVIVTGFVIIFLKRVLSKKDEEDGNPSMDARSH
jgi:cobalt/nickel transport system permease protein